MGPSSRGPGGDLLFPSLADPSSILLTGTELGTEKPVLMRSVYCRLAQNCYPFLAWDPQRSNVYGQVETISSQLGATNTLTQAGHLLIPLTPPTPADWLLEGRPGQERSSEYPSCLPSGLDGRDSAPASDIVRTWRALPRESRVVTRPVVVCDSQISPILPSRQSTSGPDGSPVTGPSRVRSS